MNRLATSNEGSNTIKAHAKIGVLGCAGRVGKLVVNEIMARHWGAGVSLAGGTIKPGFPSDCEFFVTENPDELFEIADVVIDFTTVNATRKHIWLAAKHHCPIVIGTTGLSEQDEKEINDAACETAIVYAANMSIGVTMLTALVEQAAARLGVSWDIEINETHHKHKLDAPSGTALALGKAAAKGRNVDLNDVQTLSREGGYTGERKKGAIGFSVQRGGDVVGEHQVTFFTEGERIELGHKASDRSLFAKGAIKAAIWVKDKPHGLYNMRDILDL